MSAVLTTRLYNGADGTRAADEKRKLEAKRELWPYPWVMPPKDSRPVFQYGRVMAPQPATPTVILAYTVPVGMRFALAGIAQLFTGGGLTPGAGIAVWSLILNQTYDVQGFDAVDSPLGFMPDPKVGFGLQPFIFPRVFEFEAGDLIESSVVITNAIAASDPNYFISVFLGWTWPDSGK